MTLTPVSGLCRLLDEDPDLIEAIEPDLRTRAIEQCVAPMACLARGRWDGAQHDLTPGGIGLFVLEGQLVRRVGIDGRNGAELLGEGDLLRPWHGEDTLRSLPRTTGWQVLRPCRVALLDASFTRRATEFPALTAWFVGRALERSRNLAVNMAIVHQARVDVRLQMLLWHFSDRWGKVRPDGIIVSLKISHGVLAELVAARRPTVTTALSTLARRGLVTHGEDGWLLHGDPPVELLELRAPPTPDHRLLAHGRSG